MTRSRLSKRLESQSRKTFLLSILGIIIILLFLFKAGIPFIVNLGLFLSNSKSSDQTTSKKTSAFVAPPVLDSTFDATNSANVTISGEALAKQTISLYLNNQLVNKTDVGNDNKFTFKDITLEDGSNSIKAKAVDSNDNKSDFSNELTIMYKKGEVKLTVDSPSDGQEFKKDDKIATVKGKTDAGNRVYINDFWAIVDSQGNFSYDLPLQNGDNKIKIVAKDQADNKTEKEITVKFNP